MNDQSQQTDAAVEREFPHPSKRRPPYLERGSIVQANRGFGQRAKPGLMYDVGGVMKPCEAH